jgi:hypothetical protein
VLGFGDDRWIRLVALGPPDPDVHASRSTAEQVRVGHVVGRVADVAEAKTGELAFVLADGEQVGQDLAGVELVGQRVDDRHAAVRSHLFDPVLAEGAPDDRCDLPAHDTGRVGDRLAHADVSQPGVDDHRDPAEFGDAGRERQLRAQRGLVEDEGNRLRAVQRLMPVPISLHRHGEIEHLAELAG